MNVHLKDFDVKQRLLLLLACVFPASVALLFVSTYACNVPFWDSWDFVPLLEKVYMHKQITLSDLAKQHNEHRILFPRIIMIALALLSHWNAKYEIFFSFIILIGIFYIAFLNIKKLFQIKNNNDRYSFVVVCFMTSSVIFATTQENNLIWGWQIQIFLSIFSILSGFYFLTRGVELSNKAICIAIAFGIVATYSFANGILFWPVGSLIVLLRSSRANRVTRIVGWLVVTAIISVLYFYGYKKPVDSPPLANDFGRLFSCLSYLFSYLGSPMVGFRLARIMPVAIAGIAGAIGVIVICYFLIKQKVFFNRYVIFWHGLLLYALLSAMTTAVGRSGFGAEQALSSRYITISNLYWLWIIVLGAYVCVQNLWFNSKVLATLGILFFLLFTYYNQAEFKDSRALYKDKIAARQALESNQINSEALHYVYPFPKKIVAKNVFLQNHKLSFYNK